MALCRDVQRARSTLGSLSALALVLGVLLFGFRGGGLCEKCARLDGVSVSSLVSQWFIHTLP